MGNRKRREIILKWYGLGDECAVEGSELSGKINHAIETIDGILGSSTKLVPAIPITVISILQNIDVIWPNSFSGSQYGYLYENLVNRSLAEIQNSNQGTLSLHVAVLAKIAYNMLIDKNRSFTREKLVSSVTEYNRESLVAVDYGELINKMLNVRIVKMDPNNNYRFSYPYIYYYFCGRYIARHLDDASVRQQVEYMSARLHIEDYGNIMIFVCHFANSIHVIESVLLNAFYLLNGVLPFDFRTPDTILVSANKAVDQYLAPKTVGLESDVRQQHQEKLEALDEAGIGDGTVAPEDSDRIEQEAEQEKNISEVIGAMKTMDVLGQIIRNYPGDISGENKIDIISEVHDLGMRVLSVAFQVFGFFDEDIVKAFAQDVKVNNEKALSSDMAQRIKDMLGLC